MPSLRCPACGGRALEPVWQLASVPVHSCLMLDDPNAARDFPRGALDLRFCEACGFLFNAAFDPAVERYSPAYEETQAFSPRFLRFLDELCADQARRHDLRDRLVVEIGCGKGEFLVRLAELSGCRGIGIDPGFRPERLSSPAAARLTFVRDLYGPAWRRLAADYVACRHTLEHIGPVAEFVRTVRETVGDRRHVILFFELPDLRRILAEQAFWDLYYEHASYFTAGSLARLFRRERFEVERLERAYDDQYLLLEARPADRPTAPALPLEDDLEETRALVARFRDRIGAKIGRLRELLREWSAAGWKVVIWGSGSKAVSFLTVLEGAGEIAAVVDINPHKWGKYLAGSGQRVVAPEALRALRPEVVVIMNPIYREEIGAALTEMGLEPELVALG